MSSKASAKSQPENSPAPSGKAGKPAQQASGNKRPDVWGDLPSNWEFRREAILRRVANMLREKRLSSFTLNDVAKELGMTKGNLYYYFKDKQDLVFQCHMRSMELSMRALREAVAEGATPTEQLRTLLHRHIGAVVGEGFGGILQTDLDNLWPAQRESYVQKRDDFEKGVREIIQAGLDAGEFDCSNVKLAGFTILGAVNWIPKWYNPKGPFTPEEISERVTEQLLNGLVPKGRNQSEDDKNNP